MYYETYGNTLVFDATKLVYEIMLMLEVNFFVFDFFLLFIRYYTFWYYAFKPNQTNCIWFFSSLLDIMHFDILLLNRTNPNWTEPNQTTFNGLIRFGLNDSTVRFDLVWLKFIWTVRNGLVCGFTNNQTNPNCDHPFLSW